MSARLIAAIALAASLAAAVVSPALAAPDGWVEPPTGAPLHHLDKSQDLDFLFGALKAAPDEASAKAVEQRIWARWIISSSDTTNLLMSRVKTAVDSKNTDLALKLLDAVIELKPDYVEGWNRRATLHYMRKEFAASLSDLRHVLALEPRHFGALTGLGLIMQELEQDKLALDAFRKALDVNPHLERVPAMVKKLEHKVEGQGI